MMTLLASAARTQGGTALFPDGALVPFRRADAIALLLDVTVAATAAGDLLDVFLQYSPDGTNYDDFIRFTQVLGNGGAKQYVALWSRDVAVTSPLHARQDGAMAAGVNHGPIVLGVAPRIKWVITDGGAHNQSFTFSLAATFGGYR
jgi:hypothetical protein